MRADLLIYNAGQLVTCASAAGAKRGATMLDVGIITEGAVAIADSRIVGVGTSSDLIRRFEGEDTVDAEGRLVMPGFVDPHTHVIYAGDRLDEFEMKIKGDEYLDILA